MHPRRTVDEMNDNYDPSYPAHEDCPDCNESVTVLPTTPSGSGVAAECLRCGGQTIRVAQGIIRYPGATISDAALEDLRADFDRRG